MGVRCAFAFWRPLQTTPRPLQTQGIDRMTHDAERHHPPRMNHVISDTAIHDWAVWWHGPLTEQERSLARFAVQTSDPVAFMVAAAIYADLPDADRSERALDVLTTPEPVSKKRKAPITLASVSR